MNYDTVEPDEKKFTKWFYDQLNKGLLSLAFQPVTRLGFGSTYYHEALLRHNIGLPKDFFKALEALHCMIDLDISVVSAVVRLLDSNPGLSLGCNISAQSVLMDSRWSGLLTYLTETPDTAQRLVIEVTESAVCPSQTAAVDFVARLRSTGCKIAVDDFGSGHSTLSFIRAVEPDVIKIDKGYLHRARESRCGQETLVHLFNLCGTLANHIVVEGVETEADLVRLERFGAKLAQGYYLGMPCFSIPEATERCRIPPPLRKS
ncbi:EAL domain-containing protein [Pseudomonas coronafaciens]|nr:EAL domain-containing protein [Pseudomonas coronafaciens]